MILPRVQSKVGGHVVISHWKCRFLKSGGGFEDINVYSTAKDKLYAEGWYQHDTNLQYNVEPFMEEYSTRVTAFIRATHDHGKHKPQFNYCIIEKDYPNPTGDQKLYQASVLGWKHPHKRGSNAVPNQMDQDLVDLVYSCTKECHNNHYSANMFGHLDGLPIRFDVFYNEVKRDWMVVHVEPMMLANSMLDGYCDACKEKRQGTSTPMFNISTNLPTPSLST
jgi:hypothetical protein